MTLLTRLRAALYVLRGRPVVCGLRNVRLDIDEVAALMNPTIEIMNCENIDIGLPHGALYDTDGTVRRWDGGSNG